MLNKFSSRKQEWQQKLLVRGNFETFLSAAKVKAIYVQRWHDGCLHTGTAWQLLTSQQQYHEGLHTMKRSQQLILSLAKLERAASPTLLSSQKLWKGGLIKHLELLRHLSLRSLQFYGTHHSPSFPPLHAQVATDSFEGMDQCFFKTENATKMLQVKGIKASPSFSCFKDTKILLSCQVTASAFKCQIV